LSWGYDQVIPERCSRLLFDWFQYYLVLFIVFKGTLDLLVEGIGFLLRLGLRLNRFLGFFISNHRGGAIHVPWIVIVVVVLVFLSCCCRCGDRLLILGCGACENSLFGLILSVIVVVMIILIILFPILLIPRI
jgi:hypothetical protein